MFQGSAEWEWQLSSALLVVSEDQKIQLLTQPLTLDNKEYDINLKVKQWKVFHYNDHSGWNWHKSWNLPEIECTVIVKKTNMKVDGVDQEFLNSMSLKITCYVTKTNFQSMTLHSVGCRGTTECEIQNGVCLFSSLKFCTTSYKHEVNYKTYQQQKFQLVFVLSQMVDNQMSVLRALISPFIFVDSRKHARGQVISNPIQLFVDPFLPENLERILVKKRKKNSPNSSEQITSDAQGLVNYFTAQNIRHKIKHPLFLAMRFYECVKLYMNCDITGESVINEIQRLLQNSARQEKSQKKMALFISIPPLCNNELSNKVLNQAQNQIQCILSQIDNKLFSVFTVKNDIPEDLVEIKNIHILKNKYKQLYPNLMKSKYCVSSHQIIDRIDPEEDKTSQKLVKQSQESVQNINYSQTDYLNQCYHYQVFQQQQIQLWQQNLQQQYYHQNMYYYGMPQNFYRPYQF